MKTSIARLSALAVIPLVAACGGSNSTVLNPGANGLPYAVSGLQADVTTMTSTYANIPFKAKASDATNVRSSGTYSNNSTLNSSDVTVTILSATQVQITTPHLGTVTLTDTGTLGPNNETIFEDSTGFISATFPLASNTSNIKSIFSGAIYQNNLGNGTASDTYLVSGFETNPTEMTTLKNNNASATYTGDVLMTARQTVGSAVSSQLNIMKANGGLNLTADFGTGAINGTMIGAVDNAVLSGGTMNLGFSGTISGNAFTTSGFTKNSGPAGINFSNTELSGTFYGENAQEVGGTFSANITGTDFSEQTTGAGFFVGSQ